MTLHWWMHWFWVTLWFTAITGIPLHSKISETTITTMDDSIPAEKVKEEETVKFGSVKTIHKLFNDTNSQVSQDSAYVKNNADLLPDLPPQPPIISASSSSTSSKQNCRIPKAIGINPSSLPSIGVAEEAKNNRVNIETGNNVTDSVINGQRFDRDGDNNNNNNNNKKEKISVLKSEDNHSAANNGNEDNKTSILTFNNNSNNNNNRSSLSLVKKDSKVTWILTGNNKTSRNDKLIHDNGYRKNSSSADESHENFNNNDHLAVLPLQENIPTRFKLVLNKTKIIPSTNINNDDDDKLLNKSQDFEIRDGSIEPRLLATAASILQGVSESPRLSRARSAFPGDYQQDELPQRKRDKTSENHFTNTTSSAIDIAAVTGSCLATVVLLGTMGSLGFVMYRRKYMNPPQTLNSDKCSNPDSSGYIDDSTIRDNSEEMYSLDNDSFLNSLEAMTIQNYWTDSVKHTKL